MSLWWHDTNWFENCFHRLSYIVRYGMRQWGMCRWFVSRHTWGATFETHTQTHPCAHSHTHIYEALSQHILYRDFVLYVHFVVLNNTTRPFSSSFFFSAQNTMCFFVVVVFSCATTHRRRRMLVHTFSAHSLCRSSDEWKETERDMQQQQQQQYDEEKHQQQQLGKHETRFERNLNECFIQTHILYILLYIHMWLVVRRCSVHL